MQHAESFWLWHAGSSSLTRDRTWAPCIGNVESYPLNHQRRPSPRILFQAPAIQSKDHSYSKAENSTLFTWAMSSGDVAAEIGGVLTGHEPLPRDSEAGDHQRRLPHPAPKARSAAQGCQREGLTSPCGPEMQEGRSGCRSPLIQRSSLLLKRDVSHKHSGRGSLWRGAT